MKCNEEEGFTLIELMIVVAIIAVLAGILIPNFVHARAQTATAACEANLRSIATAAELYYSDNQSYPPTEAVDQNFGNGGTTTGHGIYLTNTPVDPAAIASARYQFTNDGTPAAPHYTITCPGLHDPSTLTKVTSGSVGGVQRLQYTSDQGLGTAAAGTSNGAAAAGP